MKEQLTDRRQRACWFYIEYMNRHIEGYRDRTSSFMFWGSGNQDTMDIIERELNNEFKSTDEYNKFVQEMKNSLSSSLIPDAQFDWMKDYTSAYFAWYVLSTMSPQELNAFDVSFVTGYPPLIKNRGLKMIPENREAALAEIYTCFDSWNEAFLIKSKTMSSLKKYWTELNRELPQPFKWIDLKNDKQCEWAYSYVMNHIKPRYIPEFIAEISQNQVIMFLTAVLYSWPSHLDTRRLMLQRMKKTYKHNIFRESIVDKKVINTYVQKDIKKKLDMLAKQNGRKINEELEVIIMNAWHDAKYAKKDNNTF